MSSACRALALLILLVAAGNARGVPLAFVETRLVPPPSGFSTTSSVAIDGDTALVDATVLVRSGGVWTVQQDLRSHFVSGNVFGAAAIDGDTAVIGHTNDEEAAGTYSGAAFVFVRDAGVWTLQAKLLASDPDRGDRFGLDVDIEGDRIVVGAAGFDATDAPGTVYVFQRTGSVWTETARLQPSDSSEGDDFGRHLDLSGDRLVATADLEPGTDGAAYVFAFDGVAWSEEARLRHDTVRSIGDVALDGDRAYVGWVWDSAVVQSGGLVHVHERVRLHLAAPAGGAAVEPLCMAGIRSLGRRGGGSPGRRRAGALRPR